MTVPVQLHPGRPRLGSGLTLIEVTAVLFVLLVLVSLAFLGARASMRATERARCIMNIRQMQMSVRAYSNLKSYEPGKDLSRVGTDFSLLGELVGPGSFIPELPRCPGRGLYHYAGDLIPEIGTLYMTCTLARSEGHVPKNHLDW